MIADRLVAARAELTRKTKSQIDAETAEVWGARAVAAYEMYKKTTSIHWLVWAIEFRHEALEHAGGGPPGTLERVQAELKEHGL
jgi:hypothetical protein